MDLGILGAAFVLGIAWGSQFWGGKVEKPLPTPCVCHCDCTAASDSSSSWRELFICTAIGLCVIIGFVYFASAHRPGLHLEYTKGKGRKGVLGGTQALTLQ